MKFEQIVSSSGMKPVVRFKKAIFEEAYLEKGMLARIIYAGYDRDDQPFIRFSVDEFKAHNVPLEQPDYWDEKTRQNCLTASQAGYYPEGGVEELYVDPADLSEYIDIVDDNKFLMAWLKACNEQGEQREYVQWLEHMLGEYTKIAGNV